MLLLAPVKMLSTGKKPSIYWKFCEGAKWSFHQGKTEKHTKSWVTSHVGILGCLPLLKNRCFGGWSSGSRVFPMNEGLTLPTTCWKMMSIGFFANCREFQTSVCVAQEL